jgi:hypothetical protein
MQINMLLKIRALRKTFCTAWDGADKWFLLGVYSQVVEKVAPFTELLATVLVLTLHNSSNPLCALVLVSQNFIMSGVWNMLGFADAVESFMFLNAILLSNDFPYFQMNLWILLDVVWVVDLTGVM